MQSIEIRHNIEVAHRLSLLPGKCERVHGHSMWVELEMFGEVNPKGILLGMDFGSIKSVFRAYLDEEFDHHLLLNKDDPLAALLKTVEGTELGDIGLQECKGDPTTENIALWIGDRFWGVFSPRGILGVRCTVHETSVNAATWRSGK